MRPLRLPDLVAAQAQARPPPIVAQHGHVRPIRMPVTPTPDPPGKQAEQFGALHSHGFVRVAAAVPEVGLADPLLNGKRTVALAQSAAADGAALDA